MMKSAQNNCKFYMYFDCFQMEIAPSAAAASAPSASSSNDALTCCLRLAYHFAYKIIKIIY